MNLKAILFMIFLMSANDGVVHLIKFKNMLNEIKYDSKDLTVK